MFLGFWWMFFSLRYVFSNIFFLYSHVFQHNCFSVIFNCSRFSALWNVFVILLHMRKHSCVTHVFFYCSGLFLRISRLFFSTHRYSAHAHVILTALLFFCGFHIFSFAAPRFFCVFYCWACTRFVTATCCFALLLFTTHVHDFLRMCTFLLLLLVFSCIFIG